MYSRSVHLLLKSRLPSAVMSRQIFSMGTRMALSLSVQKSPAIVSLHIPAMQIHDRFFSSNSRGRKTPIPKSKVSAASKIGAVSSLAFVSLTKSKSILAALKLTKFASLGSMLLSVGAYTTIYGLPFASGMVGLILVHETGHALVMKKLNVPFSPMVFVPFLGAAIAAKKPPKNAYDDALIALGGPALGATGAFGVWGCGMAMDSQLLLALGDFGFMINLFNLIPVGMLDGGRIGNALSPYAGVAGVGLAGSMIYSGAVSNPIFYLITLAGGYSSGMRLWNDYNNIVDKSLPRNFYQISQRQKMIIGGSYFSLMATLFSAMAINEHYKKSPERIRFDERASGGSIVGEGMINVHRD
uniref:Peptidase M50 domain-containing protein n=1 Tax=Chaetoceros debilis TaxID=122233 RepID=A0A7S3QDR6_9STRA|mmetsp:Transcript_13674/g.20359  ORF Transcript_13674/g.20359 Transcript_13674/m.20359 type:complete len:356 (+) Transcript_13674:121-1188(+)